jgi:murein DD-endopeptidase MepM/ murein hydrolase activator NlpD
MTSLTATFFVFSPLPDAMSGLRSDAPAIRPHADDDSYMALKAVPPPPGDVPNVLSVVDGWIHNRTLYEALAENDIPAAEILSLSKSFASVFDFRNSRPKDYYRASVDDQHVIHKFLYKTGPLDEYEAVREDNGDYDVHKRKIVLDRRVVSKVFTIESSLSQAVEDGGASQQIADQIANIFAWDIDFYLYPRKGDQIAVVYESCYKGGKFLEYGNILAARYVGRQKTFSAYLFDDGHFNGYYDENGQPLKKMFLRTPVKFAHMTSAFSVRRFHPISKCYKAHTGIDYGAPTGTAIFATANGRVKFVGWEHGYGRLVILKHPNGYLTYYAHCSKLLVKRGQLVEQGQIIARVGQTGLATGPHVHYEVRVHGKPIDPNTVKKTRSRPLGPALLAKFKKSIHSRVLLVDNLLKEKGSLAMAGARR